MKACPFCEAELRDSVIRCMRCGRSLRDEPVREPVREPGDAAAETTATTPSAPATDRAGVWVTPATRTRATAAATIPEIVTRRALPADRRRSGRPDVALLLAAVAVAGAGLMAWRAIGEAWVTLVITDTSDRMDPALVGQVTLRANEGIIGAIGLALAGTLVAFGALWLLYCVDRGSTMPWFTNPVVAMGVAVAGTGMTVLSALVWFVWEQAAVGRSRTLGMTADALRAVLDQQPSPLVEIQRRAGQMRFGGAMVLGLLAASGAWWAYRKRS